MTRVRIEWTDGGVDFMTVRADDPLAALAALAEALGWLKHRQRARGTRRRLVSLEVVGRVWDPEPRRA
jgi:hypothetical protein